MQLEAFCWRAAGLILKKMDRDAELKHTLCSFNNQHWSDLEQSTQLNISPVQQLSAKFFFQNIQKKKEKKGQPFTMTRVLSHWK